jgi:hypothetical protein
MASIDQYKHKHKLLGHINCPSTYDFVYNSSTRDIRVYELLEDIPDNEDDFDGKTGDIIVGGGNGEAPTLRITIPDCFDFFIRDKDVDFIHHDQLFKAFWTPTQSFKLCDGFKQLGWDINSPIEFWLKDNICRTLINGVDKYKKFQSGRKLSTSLKWNA